MVQYSLPCLAEKIASCDNLSDKVHLQRIELTRQTTQIVSRSQGSAWPRYFKNQCGLLHFIDHPKPLRLVEVAVRVVTPTGLVKAFAFSDSG